VQPSPSNPSRSDSHPHPVGQQVYADLVRTAGDAIFTTDLAGNVVVWNDAAQALFGWAGEQIVGQPVTVLVPPECADELQRILRALAGTPEQAAVETVRLHRSGTTLPVSCRLSPLVDSDGRLYGVSAIVRDNSRELALREQLEEARQQAEARFTQSVVAQATLDSEGRLTAVNAALCRLSGYDERQLLGRPATEFVVREQLDGAAAGPGGLVPGDADRSRRLSLLRHADGRVVETLVTLSSVRDRDGGLLRVEAVVEDVSATMEAQRVVAASEAKWRSLALHAADVAFLTDPDAVVVYASPSVTPQFGCPAAAMIGADGFSFFHPDDEPVVRARWAAALQEPDASIVVEARVRAADGSWRWVEATVTNRLSAPGIEAMVANVADVTDRRRAEAVLQELAGQDALTGLATRAPLMAALDAAFAAAAAADTAVIVLDIDDFKLVNVAHGHLAGDDVLATVAARLSAAADDAQVVARLGADRFAVVLAGHRGAAGLGARAQQLVDAASGRVQRQAAIVTVTASAGAAFGPAADSAALVAAAEAALEQAKQAGRGSVCVRPGHSRSAATERALLVEDLRRGLQADELIVHYQPVLSLRDDRVAAVEALVRWEHPKHGLLGPVSFMDAAEDSGLIVAVGEKVLTEACEAAARWARLGRPGNPFHVAVNLSAKQLTAPGVVELVRRCLVSSGAQPESLVLEVTESAVMADVDATGRTLQELRGLGVSIAVDDFGTGYSSLTYLKRFPVTTLKIDRSFVSGLGEDTQDAAIVSSVLGLARAMGLTSVAEGVETDEHLLVLQALGCEYGQGFLWSPAVDADQFEAWVHQYETAQPSRPALGAARPARTPPPAEPAPSPEQQAVLRRIQELHRTGASVHTIAAALNAELLRTPEGKRWSRRSIAQAIALGRLPPS
jgi:diguanylate cyclase (GGDEF)-like protein/PAS domain S-box-containing protein